MANEQLIKYIKESLDAGVAEKEIVALLTANGWKETDIADAVAAIRRASVPKPPAPVAVQQPAVITSPVLQEQVKKIDTATPTLAEMISGMGSQAVTIERPVATKSMPVKVDKTNSPYSIILAIGLIIFLFVLGNQIFKDIGRIDDITGRLIAEAVAATGSFLVAILLGALLKESHGNRFDVLFYPYYFICGWLILWLFRDVLLFLYDKSASFGIYLALGLLILLFTGIALAVQKYRHNPILK